MAYHGLELAFVSCGAQRSSGFFITEEWVLTVKHGLAGHPHNPVQVQRVGQDGRLVGAHCEATEVIPCPGDGVDHDVALIKVAGQKSVLPTVLGSAFTPRLTNERPALYVMSPVSPSVAQMIRHTYSVGNLHAEAGEYLLNPETAKGHSGGALCFGGVAYGVLNRRKEGDPISAAVVISKHRPWITQHCSAALWDDSPRKTEVLAWCQQRIDELCRKPEHNFLVSVFHSTRGSHTLTTNDALVLLAELQVAIDRQYLPAFRAGRLEKVTAQELQHDLEEIVGLLMRSAVVEEKLAVLQQHGQEVVVFPASRVGLASVAFYFSQVSSVNPVLMLRFIPDEQSFDWRPEGVVDLGLATVGIGEIESRRIFEELWNASSSLAFPLKEGVTDIPENIQENLVAFLANRRRKKQITALCVMGEPSSVHTDLSGKLNVSLIPYTGHAGSLFAVDENQLRVAVLETIGLIKKLC